MRSTVPGTIRWGILGTGSIARKFAAGLVFADGAKLLAVGSRAQGSADRFADEFGVPHRHPSYESLTSDPDVDVIYVATPHSLHKSNSILCLNAGKAVLCEKPFTINAPEGQEVVRCAREKKLFLMEAMWNRFLPVMGKVRELLQEKVLGDVRIVTADFGFRARMTPQGRLFNPQLGGGALLDVGVYAVSLVSMVLGTPSRIAGMAHLGETGVDEQSAMILGHEQGELGVLFTAIRTRTPQEAAIIGTEGSIRIHPPWWRSDKLTLRNPGGDDEIIEVPFQGNGYNCEAVEVMNCLREGKTESDIMPLDESITIMRTMDQIRAQWGLKYPME